ncbi:MAG: DNA-directed RNA polymerase subunit beta' [Elusimicrobiota bacterium]|jgi:DNA-directed RNA polymerase subunit beta'|nr:DNA-directed RNA polymerase subunit beta' [Elusimicrobiota bacterium]
MFDISTNTNKKVKKLGELNFFDFDAIKLGIASPQQIMSWSSGEVKKPETINYRTLKPERDGLFCERIFGPTKDYECSCGKYRWVKFKGMSCDRCGVEITESKVRRERMGHIELAVPVAHVWFLRKTPSRIGILLDMRTTDLERIVYYASYVVLEDAVDSVTGRTDFKKGDLLTDAQVREAKKKHGARLKVGIGAPAIKELLEGINFEKEIPELHVQLKDTQSEMERTKLVRRIKTMEEFKDSGNRPEWMIMSVLPVIPPDLRPLVPLDGGRFAASDLNDLYRRIINRNNRLKHIESLRAPEVMIYNEKRLLQEAVDALIENGARGKFFIGAGGRPLKSLSDVIKGKHGRFRQNLLGKRVDYSGRSVIVVGPNLKLYQCGLPKLMALELFKPFIIGELMKKENITLKAAKKMLERVRPEIWDILEKVTKHHPVLLNRAPTLHRLGIQAFEPVLIEGKAIQLHPLTCAAFNADFDGDQMAVHVPLTLEAQIEARTLMMATNNILSPASGRPIASPSHDMVLGINFLTKVKEGDLGEGLVFADEEDALIAYEYGKTSLHAKIKVKAITGVEDEGKKATNWKKFTSVGRIIFNQIMPQGWKYVNKDIGKKELASIVSDCYKNPKYGRYETVQLLDRIMDTGYKYATKSGLSISIADMIVPEAKSKRVAEAQKQVKAIQKQAEQGIITEGERYNKVIDIWTKVTDEVAEELFKEMGSVETRPVKEGEQKFNSVFLMANSGARGSRQQVRQLAGMRGLMAKPQKKLTGGQGEIIESPITANFREGLSVLEYFISTHGGRKGLSDTALKTAEAGYLTRRLVDVGHNVVVMQEDCGTTDGVLIKSLMSGEEVIEPIEERILGRCSLEDVTAKDENGKDVTIIKKDDIITAAQAALVKKYEVEEIRIRSVLTCHAPYGVCAKCYGVSLATGNLARKGDTVGIIAAQSIGEPGTQLTLRTFHIGGAASRVLSRSQAVAEIDGALKFKDLKIIEDRFENKICISRNGSIFIEGAKGAIKEYKIQYGARVNVADKTAVKKDVVMAEWDPHSLPVIAEVKGDIKLIDVQEGITLQEERNKVTGIIERKITASKVGRKNPRIVIEGKQKFTYPLPIDAILLVESGDEVQAGDVLAKIAKETGGTKDITGGLPRIAELFEARRPKNPAIIAEFEGAIRLETSPKGLIEVVLRNDEINKEEHYSIPQGKHLVVYEGDRVATGEALTDGAIDPHDVLRVKGIKEVQEFLLNAIQEVYRLQGVTINDKHMEVIVRQMLSNMRIQDAGDTSFLKGEIVNRSVFLTENKRVAAKGKKEAQAETILLGISKASLASESFVSAASFQETTKVLTDAAIKGQTDRLVGLKENVIVGHLLPAGTGISAKEIAEEFEEKKSAQSAQQENNK